MMSLRQAALPKANTMENDSVAASLTTFLIEEKTDASYISDGQTSQLKATKAEDHHDDSKMTEKTTRMTIIKSDNGLTSDKDTPTEAVDAFDKAGEEVSDRHHHLGTPKF
jgi:hypothetical protein